MHVCSIAGLPYSIALSQPTSSAAADKPIGNTKNGKGESLGGSVGKLCRPRDTRAEAQKVQENNELICAVEVSAP